MRKITIETKKELKRPSPFFPASRNSVKLAKGVETYQECHQQATAKLVLSYRMHKTFATRPSPEENTILSPKSTTMFVANNTKARFGHGFPQRAKSGANYSRTKTPIFYPAKK
jgi:hypothetical protein